MPTPPIDPGAPPARGPAAASPSELGFVPQSRVRWLAPDVLLRTGWQAMLSKTVGQFADRRELQAIDATGHLDLSGAGECWLDYVSDAGDGFDATTTVASVVARDAVTVEHGGRHLELPAGELLVFGGDQAYPAASVRAYEDRLIGPYRSMLPWTARPRRLVAVPGNHDWYDGLASFLQVFCQQRWIGGWRTAQQRSYFAVRLPQGWWLWGLDIAQETYLDQAQLEYFTAIAQRLDDADALILCWAKPSWTKAGPAEPEAYAVMEFFERTVIGDRRRVRVSLSGDTHHYARYEGPDGQQKITAGGGGAYLSATHHLRQELRLPPKESRDTGKGPEVAYHRRTEYPDAPTSRLLRWGVFGAIHGNRLFWLVPALIYAVLALLGSRAVTGLVPAGPLDVQVPELMFAGALVVALGFGLVGFTKSRSARAVGLGAAHAALHLAVVLTVLLGVAAAGVPPGWSTAALPAAEFAAGALLGPLVVAAYLMIADGVGPRGTNTNELFAAQAREDHKCFLRLHIRHDGALTVYPIKIDRPTRWRFAGAPGPTERWFEPDTEPEPALIETPIVVSKR
ncbi:MAG: metallophosphoesterase family protein [Pseudonocardiaceae bacterium]